VVSSSKIALQVGKGRDELRATAPIRGTHVHATFVLPMRQTASKTWPNYHEMNAKSGPLEAAEDVDRGVDLLTRRNESGPLDDVKTPPAFKKS
jgi:hypothetical protein